MPPYHARVVVEEEVWAGGGAFPDLIPAIRHDVHALVLP